jgi:sugar lactone lactonase YvrE
VDIDLAAPRFERIVGSDPPIDQIAHGTYFGEGPVWDRRKGRDQVTVVPARRRRADEFA